MTTAHARRLPHLHCVGKPIFLTWRLAGSLPVNRHFPPETTAGKAFLIMDRLLDGAQTGPTHLRHPEIARMVEEAILHRNNVEYRLHNYVVMPNHVHLLITPLRSVSKISQSLKRRTAREANRILAQTGQSFWQDESYDRLVRDPDEFARIAHYIESNPVRAGLVTSPDEFRWSSAWPIANRPQITNLPHNNTPELR